VNHFGEIILDIAPIQGSLNLPFVAPDLPIFGVQVLDVVFPHEAGDLRLQLFILELLELLDLLLEVRDFFVDREPSLHFGLELIDIALRREIGLSVGVHE